MEHLTSINWQRFLEDSLSQLKAAKPVAFQALKFSTLPENACVYLISETVDGVEAALYVGRTKNLRRRLYTNHLMGPVSNARLKKYMMEDTCHSCFGDKVLAKAYIRQHCFVRWIFESDVRRRGALECYFTALYFPKYGIAEEH